MGDMRRIEAEKLSPSGPHPCETSHWLEAQKNTRFKSVELVFTKAKSKAGQ